jgi:hypothetical protein
MRALLRACCIASCTMLTAEENAMRWNAVLPLFLLGGLLAGCGGGRGSQSPTRGLLLRRAMASSQLTHASFGIAGLALNGMKVGTGAQTRKAASPRRRSRSRHSDPNADPGTGLSFTTLKNPDGSGRMDLSFEGQNAGQVVWQPPAWSDGSGAFPAAVHGTYQITAGELSGVTGTVELNQTDASGGQGKVHLTLNTSRGESVTADFDLVPQGLAGEQQGQFPDGVSWSQNDDYTDTGSMICEVVYSDGWRVHEEMNPDGTGTQTVYDLNNSVLLEGAFQPDGSVLVEMGDGSTATFDDEAWFGLDEDFYTDPEDPWEWDWSDGDSWEDDSDSGWDDGGDDSSWDDSGGSSDNGGNDDNGDEDDDWIWRKAHPRTGRAVRPAGRAAGAHHLVKRKRPAAPHAHRASGR